MGKWLSIRSLGCRTAGGWRGKTLLAGAMGQEREGVGVVKLIFDISDVFVIFAPNM